VAVGRDPATLMRAVSPRINLLASAEAFVEGVAAYRAAGMRDIHLPWPRTEAEVPVLRQVARDVIPALRDDAVSEAPRAASASPVRELREEEVVSLGEVYAGSEPLACAVLDVLIDQPEERLNGAMLMERTGAAAHADVTRALAALAADLAERGLARPWQEAQTGYLLPADKAALLARARSGVARG